MMDYNKALSGLVESLSAQILESVTAKIDAEIQDLLNKKILEADINSKVEKAAETAAMIAAKKYEPNLESIDKFLAQSTSVIVQNITNTAEKLVKDAVSAKVNSIDFESAASSSYESIITKKLTEFDFPAGSIKLSSIGYDTKISGDHITGGIINNFASVGIDDKSTSIKLTLLDSHTVVENHLLTNELTVKGETVFEGNIGLNGTMNTSSPGFITIIDTAANKVTEKLDKQFFADYSDIIFEKIKTNGLDLSKITLDGKEVFASGALGSAVTVSNLKKVGVLEDLQVKGDSLITNTLYTTNRRVGINTLEPHSALTLWDEEVEISIGKKQNGIAQIGTTRNQSIALSTNSKTNLLLNPNGSVTMQQMNLGQMSFSSAATPPNYDAAKGTVVFNANPSLGGPLGWVSLGNAKWANFGIIE